MASGALGPNQAKQLENLRNELDAWYKSHPNMYRIRGAITMERLRSTNDWPKFKGKAASNRHLVQWLAEFAAKHNSGSTHDNRRLACAQLLAEYYRIIKAEPRFMSDSAKSRIET
eukprot:734640-Pyramimonas_sp.AAC.1